jgi:hypothetical protein
MDVSDEKLLEFENLLKKYIIILGDSSHGLSSIDKIINFYKIKQLLGVDWKISTIFLESFYYKETENPSFKNYIHSGLNFICVGTSHIVKTKETIDGKEIIVDSLETELIKKGINPDIIISRAVEYSETGTYTPFDGELVKTISPDFDDEEVSSVGGSSGKLQRKKRRIRRKKRKTRRKKRKTQRRKIKTRRKKRKRQLKNKSKSKLL